MGQCITYKQNSNEYQELINSFLNKFNSYFKNKNNEEIKRLFLENLKSIKKHPDKISFKHPLLGNLNGIYNSTKKQLEYTEHSEATIYHELFHTISNKARKKRDSFIKFLATIYLGQKQLSVREFEEGITEYLTTCIMGETEKNIRFNYPQETTIINKLAKIYGDDIILDYYLGWNNNLITTMNQDMPNCFKKVINLCQKASTNEELPQPFENTKYYQKNKIIYNDLLFELFKKKKLIETKNLDNFKHNIKELFSFYESDIYKTCYDISIYEEELSIAINNPDNNLINLNKHLINKSASQLSKFNTIIRKEWDKLGIKDEILYNNILLNEIESFNNFATPIIIDYLDYWNKDILKVYQEKQIPSVQNNTQKENTIAKQIKELTKLKENTIESFKDNINYQTPPRRIN